MKHGKITDAAIAPAFVEAIRHNLAQPMHALMLLADFVPADASPEALVVWQARVRRSIAGMDRMVRMLGEVTRLDLLTPRLGAQRVGCRRLFADLIRRHGPEAQDRSMRLDVAGGDWEIVGPTDLIVIALDALIDNALRHAGGRRILCGGKLSGDHVALGVWDNGRGLTREGVDIALRDFKKGPDLPPADRGPDSGGLGLGLGVARRVASLSGGRLELRSRPGRGTAAIMILPRALGANPPC